MRILVGKTFGIGNACLVVPLLKALKSLGHSVDVLVGTGPDDAGASVVMSFLVGTIIDELHTDSVPPDVRHDIAIMAIPFDGRWVNGIHYSADVTFDARQRPDNVRHLGFDMWKKHEVEYQMENAYALGFSGNIPDGSFFEPADFDDSSPFYLGIGYKRDTGGFGLSKHFGNERYAELITNIMDRVGGKFLTTGTQLDMVETAWPIQKKTKGFYAAFQPLVSSIRTVQRCRAYIGNDTGMMHVAASMGLPTFGLFSDSHLMVKNPPFCARHRCYLFDASTQVDWVASSFVDFIRETR